MSFISLSLISGLRPAFVPSVRLFGRGLGQYFSGSSCIVFFWFTASLGRFKCPACITCTCTCICITLWQFCRIFTRFSALTKYHSSLCCIVSPAKNKCIGLHQAYTCIVYAYSDIITGLQYVTHTCKGLVHNTSNV